MTSDYTAAEAHLAEVEAEQAALRRIAALLARSLPAGEIFDAVVDEVRSLMGVWRTGRPARIDDYTKATGGPHVADGVSRIRR
jgi:hypothetical protein